MYLKVVAILSASFLAAMMIVISSDGYSFLDGGCLSNNKLTIKKILRYPGI